MATPLNRERIEMDRTMPQNYNNRRRAILAIARLWQGVMKDLDTLFIPCRNLHTALPHSLHPPVAQNWRESSHRPLANPLGTFFSD